MKKFYALFFIAFFAMNASAQFKVPENIQRCSTMEVIEMMRAYKGLPPFAQALNFPNEFTPLAQRVQETFVSDGDEILIPTVVHVIHDGIPQPMDINFPALGGLYEDNISEAQIFSQIDVLNEDFRRENADTTLTPNIFKGVAKGINIRFVMAQRDPDGNPTNGINRVLWPGLIHTGFIVNPEIELLIKPMTIWDPTKYLNQWSIRLEPILLGYAQFPEGSGLQGMPTGPQDPTTDGVVMNHVYFGRTPNIPAPYNLGRTATHEIGHMLGLRHSWGDGGCTVDDFCTDTPLQAEDSGGCPDVNTPSCEAGLPIQFQNYMDYTNDRCMNMFTSQQVIRMRTVLAISPRRMEWSTSDAIDRTVTSSKFTVGSVNKLTVYPNPTVEGQRIFTDMFVEKAGAAEIFVYDVFGKLQKKQVVELHFGTNRPELDLDGLAPGNYMVSIRSNNMSKSTLVVKN